MHRSPDQLTENRATVGLSTTVLLQFAADLEAAALVPVISDEDAAAGSPALVRQELLDQLAVLETIKSAVSAVQTRRMVAFDRLTRAAQREAGVLSRGVGKGVGEEIALAMRISPAMGVQLLSQAKTLDDALPHTLKALAAGEISEYQTSMVVAASRIWNLKMRSCSTWSWQVS